MRYHLESPTVALIYSSVKRGNNTYDKLSQDTNRSPGQLSELLVPLLEQGYIKKEYGVKGKPAILTALKSMVCPCCGATL